MTKTFYLQIESDTNRITDCISYEHEDYQAVELETPLPAKILSGCYKLDSGSAIYVQDWDKDLQIESLKTELLNTQLALAEQIEQQQADKTESQLALAEVIEIIEGGTTA